MNSYDPSTVYVVQADVVVSYRGISQTARNTRPS